MSTYVSVAGLQPHQIWGGVVARPLHGEGYCRDPRFRTTHARARASSRQRPMHRSDGIVLVQVTFNVGRTTEQKVALYDRAAQLLAEAAGVSPGEVFINLVEVQRENWSFEKGIAQFVPQAETK